MIGPIRRRVPRPVLPGRADDDTRKSVPRPVLPGRVTCAGNGADMAIRKRRRIFNEPGHAHYLTFSCMDRLPLLSRGRTRRWVVDALDTARQRHDVSLWAYVIMPEHVHALIWPRQGTCNLPRFLHDLKRPVSWRARRWLEEEGEAVWLRRLAVRRGRRDVFRFWLPGGGYDHNVWEDRTVHDVVNYIHNNPVRRGLATTPCDWPWSSARFWAGLDGAVLEMDPIPV